MTLSAAESLTKEVLMALAEALNRHDIDGAMALMADDCVYLASVGPELDGVVFHGTDEVRRGFETLVETYPDLHYADMRVVVDGKSAAAGWTMTGTDAMTGERIEVRGCDLFELAGGKITRKDAFRKERRPPHG
jgi:ketosteroid isomerase-like protein